ncbi:MAG: histidine phosphatase family protein [Actinomycetota bacterium]|nr:histidine phosphatase family protein [Actinomycetota bacterium]
MSLPEPTTVLLVRHGMTPTTGKLLPGRAPGLRLSETGRAQADRVASGIAALDPQPVAVYASPLERARETAAPIARALGVRVRTERGLVELDIGDWTGTSLARARRRHEWGAVQRWPSGFAFPGGESFAQLVARTTETVARLVRMHPGQTIVAVSHADPIRALVSTAAGIPLDLFQRLVVSTASVSAVQYAPDGPRVVCVNASAEGLVRS